MVLIILMLPFATKRWGSNNFRGTRESATHWMSGVCLAVREKGEHPRSKAECIGWRDVTHPRMGPLHVFRGGVYGDHSETVICLLVFQPPLICH